MKEININNYTKYSLELIFSEADKFLQETLNSINRNSNRSFLLFAFYSSVISFSFLKILDTEYNYIVLLIGTIMSFLFIKKNIFPSRKEFRGVKPELFLDDYFNNFSNKELEKEQLVTLIYSYNDSITSNSVLVESMSSRFIKSLYCFIGTLVLLILFFLFNFFQCQ